VFCNVVDLMEALRKGVEGKATDKAKAKAKPATKSGKKSA
jgi:non-homologous end joining protein Ku